MIILIINNKTKDSVYAQPLQELTRPVRFDKWAKRPPTLALGMLVRSLAAISYTQP